MYCDVDFGNAYSGIATVGYKVLDAAGSVVIARTTTGVFEIGHGKYGVDVNVSANFVGSIYWDTTAGGDINACEVIASAQIADSVLLRNWESIIENIPGRCLLQAARTLRNRISLITSPGNVNVYKEDDATVAFVKNVETDPAAEPLVEA